MTDNLRSKVIHLAHQKPELRNALLPLLKQATFEGDIKGMTFTNPDTKNKVQFSSLPEEEQKKVRAEWQTAQDKKSKKSKNVSGKAEVSDNAKVSDKAKVSGNAKIRDRVKVTENAKVNGHAVISDDAQIFGSAQISDNAKIHSDAKVYSSAKVGGDAVVTDKAAIGGFAEIQGNAQISDNAKITGEAKVQGSVEIYGHAEVTGKARVSGNAQISGQVYIEGNVEISGDVEIHGRAHIFGGAEIGGSAIIGGEAKIGGSAIIGGKAKIGGSAVILGGEWDGSEGEITEGEWLAPGVPSKKEDSKKSADLRSKVIRLAHSKPELREQLLPLLKQAAEEFPLDRAKAELLARKLTDVKWTGAGKTPQQYVSVPKKKYILIDRVEMIGEPPRPSHLGFLAIGPGGPGEESGVVYGTIKYGVPNLRRRYGSLDKLLQSNLLSLLKSGVVS